MIAPKYQLDGVTLPSGWTLVERFEPSKGATGGTFGVGYKATRGTEIAFVKAIDFVEALSAADPIAKLTELTQYANFEKDVLAYCTDQKMSRVLRYLGHDYVSIDEAKDPMRRVSCLIMEAGTTDLRQLLAVNGLESCAWNLQVMSDVSLALTQLHRGGIAHQDIKPSNVIEESKAQKSILGNMKVGDLGRVVRKDKGGPFNGLTWAGDLKYRPPELLYGHKLESWTDARESADAYMVGGLLVFLFTGASLQMLISRGLPEQFLPTNWRGGFNQDLLPILVEAHSRVLVEQLKPNLMPEVMDDVLKLARELTNPDPTKRGDPRARAQLGRPVGMDRIHQRFRALAIRCAAIERGKVSK